MISKELLTEVFKRKVRTFVLCDNILYFQYEDIYYGGISGIDDEDINIYELAHKCKEWALTKGYFIYSTNELSFIKSFSLETIETFSNGKDTEIECILKACQWILDNKDIK